MKSDGNPDNVEVENDDIAATIAKKQPLAQIEENVCGAVISDVFTINVLTNMHGPGTPRQCGPD